MDIIPKELQLPLVVVVGLIGFLIVIGLSRLSAQKDVSTPPKTISSSSSSSTNNKTPQKQTTAVTSPKTVTPNKFPENNEPKAVTPIEKKTGSIMTPGGRRSARLARSRKED